MSISSDVSIWQGYVDWQAEKAAGVALGICKASESTDFVDPTFAHNWAGIKSAGMARGAYHFVHPGDSVGAEVAYFLQVVNSGGLEANDTLWMDFEVKGSLSGTAVPQWGAAFMAELDRQRGAGRNGVYSGRWFVDTTGGPAAWAAAGLTKWPYWFSAYQSQLPSPHQLEPWTSCVLWQNTSSARIPGVHGACDRSIIEDGGFFSAARPSSHRYTKQSSKEGPMAICTHPQFPERIDTLELDAAGKLWHTARDDAGVDVIHPEFWPVEGPAVGIAYVVGACWKPDGSGMWAFIVGKDGQGYVSLMMGDGAFSPFTPRPGITYAVA